MKNLLRNHIIAIFSILFLSYTNNLFSMLTEKELIKENKDLRNKIAKLEKERRTHSRETKNLILDLEKKNTIIQELELKLKAFSLRSGTNQKKLFYTNSLSDKWQR